MTLRVLTDEQEEELVEMYKDKKWTTNEISVTFKVSRRTVYRTLQKHKAYRPKPRKRKRPKKPPRPLQPCGTNAAWMRHKRKGERACLDCVDAHNLATKSYKDRKLSS